MMVDAFTSAPIELPAGDDAFARADLIFYGVDHSGPSFEARLFLGASEADHATPRDHPDCVGSFFIFGHGGCFGEAGHCEIPAGRDPFDLRPPHQLEPAIRIVTVTDAIRALVSSGTEEVAVRVVAHTPAGKPGDVLAFETVRLATYA
jgi:hypothetical protein